MTSRSASGAASSASAVSSPAYALESPAASRSAAAPDGSLEALEPAAESLPPPVESRRLRPMVPDADHQHAGSGQADGATGARAAALDVGVDGVHDGRAHRLDAVVGECGVHAALSSSASWSGGRRGAGCEVGTVGCVRLRGRRRARALPARTCGRRRRRGRTADGRSVTGPRRPCRSRRGSVRPRPLPRRTALHRRGPGRARCAVALSVRRRALSAVNLAVTSSHGSADSSTRLIERILFQVVMNTSCVMSSASSASRTTAYACQ